MYSELPADIRDQHPYHMYDEIKVQPEAVARSFTLIEKQGSEICPLLSRARRVFVTGCGTSFHAAQGGAHLLQAFSRGGIDARSVQAYEFVTYYQGLTADDVVIGVSHSGTTTMTTRALQKARETGATAIAVTGFPNTKVTDAADHVILTGYDEERSWAHTVSYTAALATFAGLANQLAHADERLDLNALPEVMRQMLQLEPAAHRLAAGAIVADRDRGPLRVVSVGGGPNAVTAYELALKLLETSYVAATAYELEESLHGPLAAVTSETLVIIIAPSGRSIDRTIQLVGALAEIHIEPIVLVAESAADRFEHAHRLLLPDIPEPLSPLAAIVPLQLFSYFLSIGKGANPDLIHRDDEHYRLAASRYD
jgi:glucosamine--fructose-6-phosphate aminotransferase (isomerizing)